jgi:RNA polymerase sigma factor (sigma-70 family)
VNDDEAAFAANLVSASEAALRVIRSLGIPAAEVGDILQEASIRAWRHRDQRRGDFRPWFVTIAYHEARRPRRRWLTIPAFWNAASESSDSDAGLNEVLLHVRSLPKRQRLVLSLRCDAGFSTREAAQVMGISEPAAKQLLSRARETLRRSLDASAVEVAQ